MEMFIYIVVAALIFFLVGWVASRNSPDYWDSFFAVLGGVMAQDYGEQERRKNDFYKGLRRAILRIVFIGVLAMLVVFRHELLDFVFSGRFG